MMDLVEVEKPDDVTGRAPQGSVATGRILESPAYFRHGWMRITNYVAEALRNHIDTHIKSSIVQPNLTGRGRAFMRPIIEFAGRNRLPNVLGKVVLNFEVLHVEFQRARSGVIWHCFSPERARSATEGAPASMTTVGGGLWSSKRTVSVILEIPREADLESTSRKRRATAATLTGCRDRFRAGGEAGLKGREVDVEVEDEDRRRLKTVVAQGKRGQRIVAREIARLEDGRPLAFWKLKP
jgi:hypothetical protein